MINTVENNVKKFTQRQITDAKMARQYQNTAGLTTKAVLRMIDSGSLLNSPITRESIRDGIAIWGPSVANLKGKTTRSRPDPVRINSSTITTIPPHILQHHGNIILCADIMKVNKIPFLASISQVIKLGSATELTNMQIDTIVDTIVTLLQIYTSRGFKVTAIAADNGFAALMDNEKFLTFGVVLNLTSQDEHQPHVERFIRTLKERCRMCFSLLPFKRIPKRMTVELVYCQIYWYNFTIPYDYVSDRIGPGTIVLGRTYDYNKILGPGTLFGEYVQTHEDTDNTMRERTVGAITLRPSGNMQGCFYYYSLATGRRLHRRKCTPLPMPKEVIDRIHSIAERQKTPEGVEFLRQDGTQFEDIIDIDDIKSDEDSTSSEDDEETQSEALSSTNSNDGNDNISYDSTHNCNDNADEEINIGNTSDDNESMATALSSENNDLNIAGVEEAQNEQSVVIEENIASMEDKTIKLDLDVRNVLPDGEGRRQNAPKIDPVERYNLHASNPNEEFVNVMTTYAQAQTSYANSRNLLQYAVEHLILTQLGMNAGIKAFGQPGVDAIIREMKQFHDREVVKPICPSEITPEIKQRALGYLMFLKQKRTGEIKGRGCADGRPQRVYKTKQETSSPTVCTESLFIGCAMDAKEGRDVGHIDIPGAFLQTTANDNTIIKLQGVLVLTLLKINPEWKRYVTYEGRKDTPTIYSRAQKALYGTVDAAKLFYDNLTSFLVDELKFKKNRYDACVLNKTINGTQCTIMIHVDDLKISHVEESVVTEVIESLSKRYGELMPLTINRGKLHDYLGMSFDYTKDNQVTVHMYQYIDEVLSTVPNRYKEGVGSATPAPSNLYEVRKEDSPDTELLPTKEREEYHTTTAQLLYLSKRARPDLQTSIAFHCTRVQHPDRDDEKKLARTIRYLEKTKHLPLILKVNDHGIVEWWVDASFAVHEDMRSRSGMNMSLGTGTVYGSSSKQKINTASSTEAELVGVADAMSKMILCRHFMEEQGYLVKDIYVYQDNESAILLEENGMQSVGKGSRHINIKYFFVTDKVKGKELKIIHCPTEDMTADFYTKPLQGSIFIKHRNNLLGIQQEDMPMYLEYHAQYMASISK